MADHSISRQGGSHGGSPPPVVTVRYFAAAREAAGTGSEPLAGRTVGDVLAVAATLHGQRLADIFATCKVWVDGEPSEAASLLTGGEEVAVLPPVSGGA